MHRIAAVGLAVALAAALVTATTATTAAAATPEEDAAFEKAKADAAPTDGLSTFLTRYVGTCSDGSGPRCKKEAEEYRQQYKGKRLYLALEDATSVLAIGRKGEDGEVIFNLTPFFPGGELALTGGAPGRTDAAGNPVMPLLRVTGRAPDGDADRLARMLSAHQLKLEVVFSPEGTWTLTRKGGGSIKGVKSRIHALRISLARTGETVAVRTGR